MNEPKNESKLHTDYDGLWKRLIFVFFKEFLEFFLPDLLLEVDLSRPPEFLEQELTTIIPQKTAKGRMSVDKLLKFWTKNGKYKHIFVHIEVQSFRELGFTERAFKYFYRIYDREGKLITTIAVYTHDDVPEQYDRFEYSYQGTELSYKFNTYLVRDADEEKLEESNNIFALVILACKYANRTKNDIELRRKFKLKLFRLARRRGYSRKEIIALISFLDFVVSLPEEMNMQLKVDFVKEFEKEKKMEKTYIVSPTFDAILSELMSDKQKQEIAEAKEAAKKTAEKTVGKAVEKAVEKAEKAANVEIEEQRKARVESVRKLILSGAFDLPEIADITGISMEEVLKIKAELDAQN